MKNKILTTIALTTAVFMAGIFVTQAQTEVRVQSQQRTEVRSDGNTGEEAQQQERANYNNTRSNRSTIRAEGEAETRDADSDGDGISDMVSSGTNVCDGTTCPDGSCAATGAQCGAVAPAVDGVCSGFLCDSGACATSEAMCSVIEDLPVGAADGVCNGYLCDNGDCATSEAMCSMIGDVPVQAADGVCNGYLCDSGECVSSESMCSVIGDTPVQAQDYNATRSNKPGSEADPDADGDGFDDAVERANYNNSRSSRASVVGPDTNVCDGVTCADGSCAATADECSAVQAQGKDIDKASPKLYDTLSIDENSPLRSAGVEISTRADVCVSDEDCDDDDPSVSPAQAAAFRVSGDEVRGWSPEKKEAVRTRLEIMGETNPASDFGMRVATAALDDEDVVDITSDKDATEVRHKTRLRLFGFIPMGATARTRATTDGKVSVDYPWYSFLARKSPDDRHTQIAANLRAEHDIFIAAEEEIGGGREEDLEAES